MKTILLGMNNPLSDNPRLALYPYPVNSTGWRLWQLLRLRVPNVTRRQYLSGFERVNLYDGREWDADVARARVEQFVAEWQGRSVIVLGEATRHAIGVPKMLIHPQQWRGVEWRQLPHPSGRNHWYNDETSRDLAAILLEELYLKGAAS